MEVPLRRLPGKPPIFGTAAPTQDCVSPCPTQTLCPLRGQAISAVRLMTKGGEALWLAHKWARRTFPGWARRFVRSPAPSRLLVSAPPQHPRHPHPSARLRQQRTYQDHPPPPPQARCASLPRIASRAVQAMAAMAATSQNMNLFPGCLGGPPSGSLASPNDRSGHPSTGPTAR